MFKSYDVMNLTRLTQYWFRGCISAKLWSIKTKLVMLHQHHDMRAQAKVENSAPMGREIPTIHILAYNFWTVSQKIKISVSMDSLCRAESENVNYARIDWTPCRPFWNLSYIFISSEPFDILSQKSVGIINIMSWTYHRSMKTAPPTVREILRSLKKCLTFKFLSQICTFDVSLFPGLCWFWKCLICHFPKQRLSAILK